MAREAAELMHSSYYLKLDDVSLAVVDTTDYYGHGVIITRVNVPRKHRGQGVGTKILKMLLADADKHGVTLWLEISASDGLTWEQLEAWYKKHGFKWWRGQGGIMRRKPNKEV